jgi:glutathione reductase (NADPH)
MNDFDFDLLVIGAGSGGLAAAKRAAAYGARVAICERDRVGGTCVIRGCVPKKLMVYASDLATTVDDAEGYGWSHVAGALDWSRLVRRRDDAVLALERAHEGHLGRAGVEVLRGDASIHAPHEVELGGRRIRTRYILAATGSAPTMPAIQGIEHAISSDGVFALDVQPKEITIAGGGYIAVEFASILSGLGSRVNLVLRRDLPLRDFDEDLRRQCLASLESRGVVVRRRTTIEGIERSPTGLETRLRSPDGACGVAAGQAVMFAIGRSPCTAGLGLERVGVALGSQGQVLVDEHGTTSVPSIFAVGDVTGKKPLTPVAIQAARTIADRVFGNKDVVMSYENVPTAVFSDPPIATVGMTENDAKAALGERGVTVYKASFTPLYHTLTGRKSTTLVKLVVDAHSDRVLGCHMIGRDAPEIIQGFAVALKAGATKAVFDATVGIHPSAAEEFVTLRTS